MTLGNRARFPQPFQVMILRPVATRLRINEGDFSDPNAQSNVPNAPYRMNGEKNSRA